jgi:hypothetical protein
MQSTVLDLRGRPRHTEAAAAAVGRVALAGVVVAGLALAVGAAAGRGRGVIPASRRAAPDWLFGPLRGLHAPLDQRTLALLLLAMCACYLVVLACASHVGARWVWAAVVGAHVVFLLGPPLYSADLFGYVAYARLFVEHGVDPYRHGFDAAPADSLRPFVSWHGIATPYGPLFTVLSLPLATLSPAVAMWACKLLAAAGSLVCVGLVAHVARLRALAPTAAVAFVGLNPLLLVYEVGGGHNDVLPVALVLAALALTLSGRAAAGGASAVLAAVGAKASAGVVLPFVLLGARDRRRALAGALAAAALLAILSVAVFGGGGAAVLRQLFQQQELVARYSVPSRLGSLVGAGAVPSWLSALAAGAFLLTAAALLWATWRRRVDWIAAAGWTTLALLLATSWLVVWYAVWLLPLAAVGRSRPLVAATLLLCAYLVATRVFWLL